MWISIWNQSIPDALSDLEWDCSSLSVLAVSCYRCISSCGTSSPTKDPLSTYRVHCNVRTRSWMLKDCDSVDQMSLWDSIWNQSFPDALSDLDWDFSLVHVLAASCCRCISSYRTNSPNEGSVEYLLGTLQCPNSLLNALRPLQRCSNVSTACPHLKPISSRRSIWSWVRFICGVCPCCICL